MRAWATWLRTNTACSVSGSFRSATNWPRPNSRRRSSRRGTERPTYPPGTTSCFIWDDPALTLLAPHRFGGRHDSRDDVLIAGAAAEHCGQRLTHLGYAGRRVDAQEVQRGDQHARRAEAALQSVMLMEGRLQWMQRAASRDPLDGDDVGAIGLHGEHDARARGLAVEEDRAGATGAVLATDMRPGEGK